MEVAPLRTVGRKSLKALKTWQKAHAWGVVVHVLSSRLASLHVYDVTCRPLAREVFSRQTEMDALAAFALAHAELPVLSAVAAGRP